MRIFIIFLVLLSCIAQADYAPEDSSRSGLRVNFDFNSSIPVAKYMDTYSAKAGMALGYMIADRFIIDLGYEGLLNKNIVRDVAVGESNINAVLGSSFYYVGISYKYNINLRWAVALGVKSGYCNYWFELPYKDSQGDEIDLDFGSEQVLAFQPEINLYYRVREWLDASFRIGYPIQSAFEYSRAEYFSINESDSSTPYWGICLHFGFY